ncbi:MurR/RpiR family transcriptional regulator [Effusibacillus lacus]|uniref:MurR/RpiR family transcriptional regulator n=1 Tax=Effusibacillus lacus TaxID=1348429 RepID=A0A292YQL6_9BACL|nr:MurR/RpiR family transcriptional regulator [Effusibacillus lacus]TCS75724.1 RpiR family transcriptional regulator [Effusibacillus lacus]GAX91043.1 MurR/RpiR family transcriptional regulator [Effusibacillus lacus]
MEQGPTILQKITQLYPEMSHSQQMIADVILQDPETAAFYNVGEMARQANVSDSTVTRFAAFIGCSGFPALSRELQELVRSRLTTGERFQLSRTLDNDEQRMVMQFFEDDVQNIMMMRERIDLGVFERTIDSLVSARRVGIVCSRSTVSLGLFFEFYLNLLNKEVTLFTGEPRTLDLLNRFGPEDVIVGIGFARYSRLTVDCLQFARKKGVQIVAITDYPSSPLTGLAHEVLFTPTGIASHMDSFAAPLSLVTALLRVMAHRAPEQVSSSLHVLEDVWTDFGIYVTRKK